MNAVHTQNQEREKVTSQNPFKTEIISPSDHSSQEPRDSIGKALLEETRNKSSEKINRRTGLKRAQHLYTQCNVKRNSSARNTDSKVQEPPAKRRKIDAKKKNNALVIDDKSASESDDETEF